MHLNYYFLRFLSEELKNRLIGFTLAECYLQSRYECVLGFHNFEEEFFIKLNLFEEFTCLAFPEQFSKNKKGTYNLFKELNGLKVKDIVQHENDRSFHLVFENEFSLMFKLYGSRSNLILFYQNSCIDVLNKKLHVDTEIELTSIHKIVEQNFNNFIEENENLRKIFPAFDKEIIHLIESEEYKKSDGKAKWLAVEEWILLLSKKNFYFIETEDGIKLSFFSTGKIVFTTTSAIEACNYYDRYQGQLFYFRKEKQEALNYLQQKKKKVVLYLTTIELKLKELQEQTRYEEIGHILMANLYQLPKNTEVVELTNFYTNQPISIKIKKTLSPALNAENYFRKGKNQKIELEEIRKNILNKKIEKDKYEGHIQFIADAEELKILRKYLKDNNLLEDKARIEKDQISLFRRFMIEGFEILVGKSAKNNDLLTQKYSFKEDLWLHARDVAGSHVLIKYKAGKKFSKTVIEKAAQLAAYYSKRKTDTLCPVTVTPKKYVRKPKGALEGQVVIEREEVVLVKPASFDELEIT